MSFDDQRDAAARRYQTFVVAARLVLVVALVAAAWFLYHGLPSEESSATPFGRVAAERTTVRVVLRTASPQPGAADAVELYSIDVRAAEREYLSERRAGMRFEEFLRARTRMRPRVGGSFDEAGVATLAVAPGRWWVHARHAGENTEWTWRVPVNITGREQIIELTPENAYTRTQSY